VTIKAWAIGLTPHQTVWWALGETAWDFTEARRKLSLSENAMHRALRIAGVPILTQKSLRNLLKALSSPGTSTALAEELERRWATAYAKALDDTSTRTASQSSVLEIATSWTTLLSSASPVLARSGRKDAATAQALLNAARPFTASRTSPTSQTAEPSPLAIQRARQIGMRELKRLLRSNNRKLS